MKAPLEASQQGARSSSVNAKQVCESVYTRWIVEPLVFIEVLFIIQSFRIILQPAKTQTEVRNSVIFTMGLQLVQNILRI